MYQSEHMTAKNVKHWSNKIRYFSLKYFCDRNFWGENGPRNLELYQ